MSDVTGEPFLVARDGGRPLIALIVNDTRLGWFWISSKDGTITLTPAGDVVSSDTVFAGRGRIDTR